MLAKLLLLFGLGMLMNTGASGQQPQAPVDADKKRQFLRAREEMRTIPMTPSPESTPKPKPRPLPPPTTPVPEPVPEPKPEATPMPRPQPRPEPEATPRPRVPEPVPRPQPSTPEPATPRPRPSTPAPVTPPPRVTPAPAPPQVFIEKSNEQGDAPAPPSGWFKRWKYLSSSVRSAIDRAGVRKGRWRYIVIHNSGTRQGNAKAFEYYHKRVRKMQNGLAYHFVVGNGTSSGDGAIEIGNRWSRQINGGHVHSDYLNNIALGICLVGDFNRQVPTRRQLEATEELTRYLRQRVGKIDRKFAIVKAHREINPPRWPT
ncbi:MAG: N-acetylmuramoyl-L-alanine amidase, partial [Chthoniobacter sp.]|nr:N-acetylmuramoyl-L-alanine amidase [Chthoniobacter sp.]